MQVSSSLLMDLSHLVKSSGDANLDQVKLAVCYFLHGRGEERSSIFHLRVMANDNGMYVPSDDFHHLVFTMSYERLIDWNDNGMVLNKDLREKLLTINRKERNNGEVHRTYS